MDLDLHLCRHRVGLVRLVTDKVVCQYCVPFSVVQTDRMARCLRWDLRRLEEVVSALVSTGRLADFGVDGQKGLLVRRGCNNNNNNNRKGSKVFELSQRQRRQVGKDLLRLSVLEQGFVVQYDTWDDNNNNNNNKEITSSGVGMEALEEEEGEDDNNNDDEEFDGVSYLSSQISGADH
jgi:hypothetical protein